MIMFIDYYLLSNVVTWVVSWLLLFLWIPQDGCQHPKSLWRQIFKCWHSLGHIRESSGVKVVVVGKGWSQVHGRRFLTTLCLNNHFTFLCIIHTPNAILPFCSLAPYPATCPFELGTNRLAEIWKLV